MPQTISDNVLSALAAAYFGRVQAQGPATLYVAFFIGASSPLTGGTEATGNNYSRIAVTNNQTNFPAPTGSAGSIVVRNGTDIVSARSTGSWGGGPINCVRIYDSASGGTNLIAGAMLPISRTVDADGIRLTIEANQLSFTLASS